MTTRKLSAYRFAICIDNAEYPAALETHKIYRVLMDKEAEREDLRIVDESGEEYLYPAEYFVLVNLPRGTVRALSKSFTRGFHQAG